MTPEKRRSILEYLRDVRHGAPIAFAPRPRSACGSTNRRILPGSSRAGVAGDWSRGGRTPCAALSHASSVSETFETPRHASSGAESSNTRLNGFRQRQVYGEPRQDPAGGSRRARSVTLAARSPRRWDRDQRVRRRRGDVVGKRVGSGSVPSGLLSIRRRRERTQHLDGRRRVLGETDAASRIDVHAPRAAPAGCPDSP